MEILAALTDIEQLCNLYNEFFTYNAELQPEYYNASKESGKYPESVITDKNADIVIAVENDIIVGFIHIREAETPFFDSVVPHKYVEVIDFIVTASHREKGVGSKLMNASKEWGKARNLDYIELFVLSNAREAYAFYQRNGFDTISHTMRYTL